MLPSWKTPLGEYPLNLLRGFEDPFNTYIIQGVKTLVEAFPTPLVISYNVINSYQTYIYTYFFNPSAGKTSSDHSNHNIIRLVASLSTQVCKLNPPFCGSLHEKHSSAEKAVDFSVLRDREMMLLVGLPG